MRYFHGGRPGLAPGETIKSAAATGIPSVSAVADAYRKDRVYITTSESEARDYAGLFVPPSPSSLADLGGAVYEVEPLGPVEPDRDYEGQPGVSWETTEARVLRVVDERVRPDLSGQAPGPA